MKNSEYMLAEGGALRLAIKRRVHGRAKDGLKINNPEEIKIKRLPLHWYLIVAP